MMQYVSDDLTVDDFLTGIIAAAATKGIRTLSMRDEQFFAALEESFRELEKVALDHDVDVRFVIQLDPLYGDSPVIREAVSTATLRKFISLDNPEFIDMRIKFGPDEAERLLNDLPGDRSLHLHLAEVFLDSRARLPV